MLAYYSPFSAIIFAFATGFLARIKGYNWIMWSVLGIVFAPIPFLIMSFSPIKEFKSVTGKNMGRNFNTSVRPPAGSSHVKEQCPACGKEIAIDASLCKHCGESFDIIDT